MEYLDIVTEDGLPTGEIVERTYAHRHGIRHRTAHVWLLRRRGDRVEVLLQRRSEDKDSNPGCLDISSAGHIPAGVDFVPSALRELWEELGVTAQASDLHFCGDRSFFHEAEFHGQPFLDRQVSRVFYLWLDREPQEFTLQASEVSQVVWMDFDECLKAVRENTIRHCIAAEELELVQTVMHNA